MADSWNWPGLINKIAQDVPFLQRALNALLKQDPTSIEDAPSGAKRLYEASSGKWQWQEYNGSLWDAVPFLQHNVDQLDGYHAAITPAANTVAVRNASGLLEDSITGNAATASSAATLSQTLPVAKGGTGATSAAAARTNLGVPPTSHASSGTAYGLATDANYGHVRSDGDTTNIVIGEVVVKDVAIGGDVADLASTRGQIGKDHLLPDGGDLNDLRTPGNYGVRGATWSNVPEKTYARVQVINGAVQASGFGGGLTQLWCTIGLAYTYWFSRSFIGATQTWSDWVKLVDATDLATSSTPGIVKPGAGMNIDAEGALNVAFNNTVTSTSTTQAATANSVKTAYDKAVEAEGKAGISKVFNSRLVITTSNAAWAPPVTGWARVTVIGGGGAGGCGFNASEESGGGGGGGGAGDVVTEYVYLSSPVKIVIGAGGIATSGMESGFVTVGKTGGQGGESSFGIISSSGGQGGTGGGANGRGGGAGGSAGGGSGGNAIGGCGGYNGTQYGGGGGGGAGQAADSSFPSVPGKGSANGLDGSTYVSNSQNAGGSGGSGAVIIEYYDPSKEVA